MLKSTYPAVQATPRADPTQPSLPPAWTEHKAPSGHIYYYNRDTKQSTYTRPILQAPVHTASALDTTLYAFTGAPTAPGSVSARTNYHTSQTLFFSRPTGTNAQQHDFQRSRPRQPEDRPKSKHQIPGCAPWLLIKTKLGRRFVHNPDTNESFWKFPKEIAGGVVELDIQEREKKERKQSETPRFQVLGDEPVLRDESRSRPNDDEDEEHASVDEDVSVLGAGGQPMIEPVRDDQADHPQEQSDEYEEVEVTDDEDDEEQIAKRLKEEQDQAAQIEFGEDDMSRQLAEMGGTYELDPGEYGAGEDEDEWEEGADGIGLTPEEAAASFMDLLDDFRINPYTTWDTVVEDGHIIEDDRYTLLPNMKTRKEVFATWSASRIEQRRLEKERMVKQDPRIRYLAFLQDHATPKLYWPEFRRKYKKEPELKDVKLSDKEREKLYREHLNRITKLSERQLEDHLKTLLGEVEPSEYWNSSTKLHDALPEKILADIRYISPKPTARDAIMKSYIFRLPSASEISSRDGNTETHEQELEREKREQAFRNREAQVEEVRMRQEKELRSGRRRLGEGEMELERAMRVGKGGLKAHFDDVAGEAEKVED